MFLQPKFIQKFICSGYSLIFAVIVWSILLAPPNLHASAILKVGVYNNSPTIFVDGDGKVRGLFIDILEDIASKEKWQLQYVFGHWTDVYDLLQKGEIDILPAIAFSSHREKLFDFTDETVMANWAQVYTPRNQNLASLIELEGKKIAVKAGDIHFAALKKLTRDFNINCRFIEVEDYETIFEMLDARYLDIGVVNRLFGNSNRFKYKVQIAPVVFNPIEMRYAEPRGRGREIINIIDNYLVSYKYNENSIYYQAVKRWLLSEAKTVIPSRFWYMLGGVGVVSLMLFGASMLFRYQVKRRTRELMLVNSQLASEVLERKKAEEDLRVSGERINAFFRSIDDAIFVHPLLEKDFAPFLEVNKIASERYGYTREEFLEMTVKDITREEDGLKYGAAVFLKKLLEAGQMILEAIHIRKNGETFPVEINVNVVEQEGTLVILSVVRDITARKVAQTERRQLEAQLRQAQKMDSIGRLAGGVAHDFNNMLGVILGHAEIALCKVDTTMSISTNLLEICKAAERSANLTHQLLAFARKQAITPQILDLNETVAGVLKMLQRLIGENISLGWIPGEEQSFIKIDPGQIDQLLTNLCINGRDAISGAGEIVIRIQIASLDDAYCAKYAGLQPGEYVLLTISDSGGGMDKETEMKIFDPFFTTKELGKGTGLGLATVYGIVKQNNGFVGVESDLGSGTTFKVYLPRYKGKVERKQEKIQVEIFGNQETILLVEDEPALLEIVRWMLESAGFLVLSTNTSAKAVELAGQWSGEINLLLTDVVMPKVSGLDLSQQLMLLFPKLKCLYMSGYTADVISRHGVLDEGLHFIQKPFDKQGLVAAVQEVLGNEQTVGNRAEH